MTDTWLVAGGAGYIGAHVVRSLQAAGVGAVVIDDLSTGEPGRVAVPFVHGDIGDLDLVADTLRRYRITGVVQLAADKQVAESMSQPLTYYRRNVVNLVQLLTAMAEADVTRLVFSSSAAVYGMVETALVGEDHPTRPINPYGETKLVGEWLIRDQARATGLRFAALRYFNVAGTAAPELGDLGRTNLIPMVFDALERGEQPVIFGNQHRTPDGTCVRDFIHVQDLADAHVAAIATLDAPAAAARFNVGCGRGYSVREVIEMVSEVSGRSIEPRVGRPDPAIRPWWWPTPRTSAPAWVGVPGTTFARWCAARGRLGCDSSVPCRASTAPPSFRGQASMTNTALLSQDGSAATRFDHARSRLAGAQKPTASVPAYLRFVNRKAGGLLAALAYALRLTPTQVTLLSSAVSFCGIAVLALHTASVPTGITVSALLLLGYALDSADGQLARVRGGGSRAGEWLDHVTDIAKISSLHSAVAIAVLRFFELDSLLYLAVPVVFLVANVTQFFGMMLRDKLAVPAPGRPDAARSSSLLVAWVLLPLDHGSLALAFLVLGVHTLFLWCYGFLALCTVLFSVRSLTKAYRSLLAAEPARTSQQQ